MEKRPVTHTFTVAPYGLLATICTTKLGWSGYAPESPATGLLGAFLMIRDGHFLIGWFDGRLSTLVHECVHAAEAMLSYVGITPKGEALAYLTEHLFQKCRAMT
jgi:hypothetical protein